MNFSQNIKKIVRDKYSQIVEETGSCCECDTCADVNVDQNIYEDYTALKGYVSEADLHLGCGIPTEYANIQKDHTVVDLGSGAGNDAFVALRLTGENGRVVGIDMTEKMIQKARENAQKLKYKNVEFRLGDIENIPLQENSADVVISNCVLNLVPDKQKAFNEIYRILKPGGHFCISDIVASVALPPRIQQIAALYTGCISGALEQKDYLNKIEQSGFKSIEIKSTKKIKLPTELVQKHLNHDEQILYPDFVNSFSSVTIVGVKV